MGEVLSLRLESGASDLSSSTLLLVLKNTGNKNYVLQDDVIMKPGFLWDRFDVKSSNGAVVKYIGMMAKYSPQKFVLQSGEEISTQLDLMNAYNITRGSYDVCYSVDVLYFEDGGAVNIFQNDTMYYHESLSACLQNITFFDE
ncbi:hypothetical protein Bandiella_01546 (plasmid) [Candidatus Bandiella woodruffii]|uniref:Uncharacterized protein n=2 Tax=Candidatus Bandiella euplotis TaxID=1664265 RepID=A0ABZ0UQ56_9RICK|nr:hypothetical protein Bandiella_01546 [Candidatus Bandiella woodruffii]